MKDVGRVFDRTLDHPISPQDTSRFVAHYFPGDELAGRRVLDAGSRLGDYSAAFLDAGAARVVGLDVSALSVAAAGERWAGRAGLDFRVADVRDLGDFADDSFDVTVCASALSYLPPAESRRALAELIRVTAPGGTLLLLFLRPQGLLLRTARRLANALPMPLWAAVTAVAGRLPPALVTPLLGRSIDRRRLRYLLWGLQGTHFGVPVAIPQSFEVTTVRSLDCAPETLISYKIPLPADKRRIAFSAAAGGAGAGR